jgi:hypothetical protein
MRADFGTLGLLSFGLYKDKYAHLAFPERSLSLWSAAQKRAGGPKRERRASSDAGPIIAERQYKRVPCHTEYL